ncbi:hypothetical protein [Telmatospirillum sp.]|uniref:hypothetical protein n=1 Tax=Telmatospirillum sp. TaxID=2079197 RepID=UPI00284732DF|nr:hypothetical protein [Telmatospirillum sp.]MDR3441175.1 hypothetical protein [Telmatospirillum sp.]
MDQREMYGELNALLGAIAKALDIEAEQAARAVEQGDIAVEMREDERGERFLSVLYQGRSAKVYQGAIRYAPKA